MIRPLSVDRALVEQLAGDPLRGDQVDVQDGVPAVLVGVGQLLVAGDAGVVDDDVDPAVLLLDVVGDSLRCVLAGDVQDEVVAVELAHQRLELAGSLGYVDPDDRGAVPVEDPGDLFADTAAGAGHQGHLAGQRADPVRRVDGLRGAGRADPDDLA